MCSYLRWGTPLKDRRPRRVSAVYVNLHQAAGRRNLTMNSAGTMYEDDTDLPDLEPGVLSYTQFRNQEGLQEWRRRRALYEQGQLNSVARGPRVSWRVRALHAVNRL